MLNFPSIFFPTVFHKLTLLNSGPCMILGYFCVALLPWPSFPYSPSPQLNTWNKFFIIKKVKNCINYTITNTYRGSDRFNSILSLVCKPLNYVTVVVLTSYLSLYSNSQSVTIRALRGGHLLHVPMGLQHKFFGHGLVVGVPQAQTAIAAFSTCFHWTICRYWEGTVLSCLNLKEQSG